MGSFGGKHARAWYSARSLEAAAGFLAEYDLAIAEIADAPLRWPLYVHGTRRSQFRNYPYSVVYRVARGGDIEVIAIMHDRRRPGYWRSR